MLSFYDVCVGVYVNSCLCSSTKVFTASNCSLNMVLSALEHIPLNIKDDQGFGQTRIPSVEKYRGDERGIQGHQNSCYLDATIFGLFALSDVFDSLFLRESKDEVEENVKHTLWTGIVNPLRKYVNIFCSIGVHCP